MDTGSGFTRKGSANWDPTLLETESGLLNGDFHVIQILGQRLFRRWRSDYGSFWEQHFWETSGRRPKVGSRVVECH
jgi:hypothetical protein